MLRPSLWPTSYICTWLLALTIALTRWTFCPPNGPQMCPDKLASSAPAGISLCSGKETFSLEPEHLHIEQKQVCVPLLGAFISASLFADSGLRSSVSGPVTVDIRHPEPRVALVCPWPWREWEVGLCCWPVGWLRDTATEHTHTPSISVSNTHVGSPERGCSFSLLVLCLTI